MTLKLQTVPDTNVVIAAHSKNPTSPNREYYERWQQEEIDLLYSNDTLAEYGLKLSMPHFGLSEEEIDTFLENIAFLGVPVEIDFFHLRLYPEDPDDISFVLCAENGNATHLISYDHHILDLQYRYNFEFKICKIIEFLHELRERESSHR